MLAARQAGGEAEETISRFGRRAQIPILPIFDLVPHSPTRRKNKDPFQNSSHNQRMEHEVDAWIVQLTQCKQLSESDVKTLCDRVRILTSTPVNERWTHLLPSFLSASSFSIPHF